MSRAVCGDAFERHLQVAMDVVVERLQRRDVEDAHAARQRRLPPQRIEAGEERGQRLAGAGRREDERVLSRGDGRPAEPLRRRRLAERGAKPVLHRRQKQVKGIGGIHAGYCTNIPYVISIWIGKPRPEGDTKNETLVLPRSMEMSRSCGIMRTGTELCLTEAHPSP